LELFNNVVYTTVLDLDQNINYSVGIDTVWHMACIYEANDKDVTVYTVRLNDGDACIEWALYQFSSPTSVKQIRTGSICLPRIQQTKLVQIIFFHESRVMLKLSESSSIFSLIIFSIASSGCSQAPKYSFRATDSAMPIPLLKYGCRLAFSNFTTLYCDQTIDYDQMLRLPDAFDYKHIIGNLYCATISNEYGIRYRLVDINKKEVIRTLDAPGRCNGMDRMHVNSFNKAIFTGG
jgi:hypothetical protein